MKYFRSYPWAMQLLLFLLMTFTFLSCAGLVVLSVFSRVSGFTVAQLAAIGPASPAGLINAALVVRGVNNLFIYFLPAVLFAYLAHPRPGSYLSLKAPGKKMQLPLAILLLLGASPILMLIEHLVSLINFGADVKAANTANQALTAAIFNMPTFASFIRVFVLVAIVPAFGEEMFFRGIMMRFAKKRSRNMLFPVLFSAAIFAYAHSTVYGLLSIFLAGILLAVIYNLTGSLWCSIAAHLSFNGYQIILTYIGNSNPALKAFMANDTVPYYLIVTGAIVFGVSLYLLIRNKTPLPPNWSDDFTHEELIIFKAGQMK